jgi:hypothetical protein
MRALFLGGVLALMLAHSADAECRMSVAPYEDCNGCTRNQQIKVLTNTDCAIRSTGSDGIEVVTGPRNGTFTSSDPMWLKYVPKKDFVGQDSMTFRAYYQQRVTGKRTFIIIRSHIDVVADAKSLILR